MSTRTKGVSAGPLTVIVAATSRWPGAGGRHNNQKKSRFRRTTGAVPHAVARGRQAMRQVERAGMMLGVVAAGLELLREIRFAESNGTPSRHSPARSGPMGYSQPAAGRTASTASRARSTSGGNRSVSKSRSRASTKRPRSRSRTAAKKTRGVRATATKQSGSPARSRTRGGVRTRAKRQTMSRASERRTTSSGRSRSSSRK